MRSSQVASEEEITQAILDKLNVPQARQENKAYLQSIGGIETLSQKLGVSLETGLTSAQVHAMRSRFGTNSFPEAPMKGFLSLLFEAFQDTTELILISAATVSVVIGIVQNGAADGWIEGGAILIAVFLVATVTAGNDYTKELQFRALEKSSQGDERCSVIRDSQIERINPKDLVVGDLILLQAGDMIPADSIICDSNVIKCNESALTGESDDLNKSKLKDCFLLSSCLVTEGEGAHAMVIGIGPCSQWGNIKANLVSEAVNTPLQDKLEHMAEQIGYIGLTAAVGTFVAMIISIWARHEGKDILGGFIEAFIISVTIIVVAIPEGLPLAVTIALAYSTKKMYQDQCFIRVLSACETMGNATNICSDKTGTLTENRMTVVEGYFAGIKYSQIDFISLASAASSSASSSAAAAVSAPASGSIAKKCKDLIAENACINRIAYLVYKDANGKELDKPNVIGSKTEGALIMMCKSWGYDDNHLKTQLFKEDRDKLFAFNSLKKRSTAIYHQPEENRTRLLCKGASEWVIKDCTHYLTADGSIAPLTSSKLQELNEHIINMANNALRTLCLAHRDFSPNTNPLPEDWKENPPDGAGLCLDCIVGIIDPLRPDVIEAVRIAQGAGVTVRMVTGDNLNTACAIARQCGILTDEGQAIEGPVFRQMTPAAVDEILPNLQVVARSSPEDKYLLVTRLNGYAIPDGKEEWEEKHKGKIDVAWETHKDLLLPGYKEEWLSTRPYGGQVVGVTGDGTNDAPALKAADVGLAMGIAGTKVAQSASDIVILDDKFSSIVKAIMWGRSVYDNIRKFLQFQLTVNVVALVTVFIGACAGFPPPLNAVMMLWINLIMDTLGALALATEGPTMKVLERKPYKRNAFLVSRPMMRNIIVQSALQLILIFVILFGHKWFNVEPGERCAKLDVKRDTSPHWITGSDRFYSDDNIELALLAHPEALPLSCSSLISVCKDHHSQDSEGDITQTCYEDHHTLSPGEGVTFNDLRKFSERCIDGCQEFSWVHGSLIFNTFVFAQIFNEYNAKSIHSEWDIFTGFFENHVHLLITFITLGLQVMLIEVAGPFMKTSPLTINQWLISLGLGALAVPVGILMRFIPCEEDPETFFDNTQEIQKAEEMMKTKKQNLEIA